MLHGSAGLNALEGRSKLPKGGRKTPETLTCRTRREIRFERQLKPFKTRRGDGVGCLDGEDFTQNRTGTTQGGKALSPNRRLKWPLEEDKKALEGCCGKREGKVWTPQRPSGEVRVRSEGGRPTVI